MLVRLSPNKMAPIQIRARLAHIEGPHVEPPGWMLRNGTICKHEMLLNKTKSRKIKYCQIA
jgi:hypothetical protein